MAVLTDSGGNEGGAHGEAWGSGWGRGGSWRLSLWWRHRRTRRVGSSLFWNRVLATVGRTEMERPRFMVSKRDRRSGQQLQEWRGELRPQDSAQVESLPGPVTS